MTAEVVLSARRIGKAYPQFKSGFHRVASWFTSIGPMAQAWVLRDVDLDVAAGESVGLIGVNGAGKSTLLRVVAGVMPPTEGELLVNGRVSAILELGLGFNGDLTGRDNVINAAGLMGYSRATIEGILPEVESFADIGAYFHRPMREYSSGMQMRVAFAVATAKRPDLLIVDEALSVGDISFQQKSFQRIRDFRSQGTALILVSHDRAAIQSICHRAVLLEQGRVIKDGTPEAVLDHYNARLASGDFEVRSEALEDGRTQTVSGTGEATFADARVCDERGAPLEVAQVGQRLMLKLQINIHCQLPELVVGIMIRDRLGQTVFGTNTAHLQSPMSNLQPGERITLRVMFPARLGPGEYGLTLALQGGETHLEGNYQWIDHALGFSIVPGGEAHFIGCAWLEPEVRVNRHLD